MDNYKSEKSVATKRTNIEWKTKNSQVLDNEIREKYFENTEALFILHPYLQKIYYVQRWNRRRNKKKM